jgi:hypothetical protein
MCGIVTDVSVFNEIVWIVFPLFNELLWVYPDKDMDNTTIPVIIVTTGFLFE